jgi:hypothetical protein
MPAPDADTMTPDTIERNLPAGNVADQHADPVATEAPVVASDTHANLSPRDAEVLHVALARVCRLLGYSDEHMPEHASSIDASGVDERIAGLVAFAATARLP